MYQGNTPRRWNPERAAALCRELTEAERCTGNVLTHADGIALTHAFMVRDLPAAEAATRAALADLSRRTPRRQAAKERPHA